MPNYHVNLRIIGTDHIRLYTEEAPDLAAATIKAVKEAGEWGYSPAQVTVVNAFLIEDEVERISTVSGATLAVLRLLNTPLVKDIDFGGDYAGDPLSEVLKPAIYSNLSSGERAVVDTARQMWQGSFAFSTVDMQTRRRMLKIIVDFYADGVLTLG